MKINKASLAAFFKRLLALLTHNCLWKLLSLLIAVCLWSGLITQDDSLTREKVFNDVPISVINDDTLRRNGYIIVSGLENLPTVRIRVDVPQRMYNTVSASNFNVRVDLSRIRGTGEQTLTVLASNSATYGTVTEISAATVPVQVEEYISRSRIPVRLNISGTAPAGFFAADARVDPSYVVVSGPRSLVSSVVRCVADYNMSVLSATPGTERTAVPFRLVDASGNEIDASLISVTSESVQLDSMTVEQTLYTAKDLVVNTSDLITGEVPAGYEIKRITAEPSVITLAGSDRLVSAMTELHLIEYLDQAIDISGLTSTLHRNVRLTRPEGVAYLSNDTILITVEIGLK